MRPVKLTMTAFGPYASTEMVDFREVLSNGLFGIYGETGSGKSTIFSAITFALFGEAAKSEQEMSSLRSDHAARSVLTEVEFIFEVGGKRFLVRRRPDQMRPALKGDGETKETHKAWLFDVSGVSIEAISRENQGKVIAEKKVGVVKEAIIDLLGYGPDQFKQIVFLPQGKFESFLSAKTDERLKILRELFDVSLYRFLSQRMREKAKAADEEVRRDRDVCAGRLSQEGFESPDALKEGIASTSALHAQALLMTEAAKVHLSKSTHALQQGEQLAEKFKVFEQAQSALTLASEGIPQRKAQEQRVENAEKAQSLLEVDRSVSECRARVITATTKNVDAKAAYEDAKWKKQEAESLLEEEDSRAGEREELHGRIQAFGRYEKTLIDSEGLQADWKNKQRQLTEAQAVFDTAAEKHQELQNRKNVVEEQAQKSQENSFVRERLVSEKASIEQQKVSSQEYYSARSRLENAQASAVERKQRLEQEQEALQMAEVDFENAERDLADAQAIHLADKLHPGQPCSVCGATEHPAPAKGNAESAGLDQAFRDARERRDEMRRQTSEAAQELSSAQTLVEEREAGLERLVVPESSVEDLDIKLQSLEEKLKGLGQHVAPEELVQEFASLNEQIVSAAETVEEAREKRDDLKTNAALAQQKYQDALGGVPEEFQVRSALDAALKQASEEYQNMLSAFEEAQEGEQQAREGALIAAKDLEAAAKMLETAQQEFAKASQHFAERLGASGVSNEQYEKARSDIDQIEVLRVEIDAHKAAYSEAKGRLSSAREAIDDREYPELEVLLGRKLEAEQEYEARLHESNQLKAKVDQLMRLRASVSSELARIEKLEMDTAAVRELAALFNAQNAARLELETFAIGAMFDQVLHAANLRLSPMSNGRYSLEREIDGGKGAARRGLGIRVHDIFTGKTRAATTLSGGETFIAALALALGLSDIVESSAGNVRLDTLFIDEGFGSLDTENDTGTLDQVLQTLQDLVGDSRAVGLISHVPLVQQAIPNGFSIKKTPAGSHIETRRI